MAEKNWGDADSYDLPEGEFCVYGTIHIVPEHADKVEALNVELTKLASTEEGMVYYCLARDRDDRSVFHLFERYASNEAFRQHCEQELVQKLINSGWMKDVKVAFVKPITA